MAKIGSILDGGKGKLGNLVLYKMKGQNIIRTKPDHFTDSKTPGQLDWRERFSVMNRFLNQFSDSIRITYAGEAGRLTALNVAVSKNIHRALAGEYPDISVDKSKVLLSQGPLQVPAEAWLSAHPEGYQVEWVNGPEAVADAASDFLVVLILFSDGKSDYRITDTRRKAGRHVIQSVYTIKDLAGVWITFRNRSMTAWSDSKLAETRE